jgi:glycosyltransferase involved in cell wall biosynthesis
LKVLFLNQSFYPDVVSSAQHLADAALALVERGHAVTVLAGRRAQDDPETLFEPQQWWRGVRIIRLRSTGFGKENRWGRTVDSLTLLVLTLLRGTTLSKPDLVVALTSPPFIGLVGLCLARWYGARLVHWTMDLNPDEAIAAGWLSKDSLIAGALEQIARRTLCGAEHVIVLDRFMRGRVLAKGVRPERVAILPPWAHEPAVGFNPVGRQRFRRAHGLEGKFVVMYSGNHSPCHPLNTVIEAAEALADTPEIFFCFVGGGSEFRKIQHRFGPRSATVAASRHRNSPQILCLPYQSLAQLSASLSAADLHLVIMGDPFVGVVHPCKIYNILAIGSPVIYIGPTPSPTLETLAGASAQIPWGTVSHGDVAGLIAQIQRIRQLAVDQTAAALSARAGSFSPRTLVPRLIAQLESSVSDVH